MSKNYKNLLLLLFVSQFFFGQVQHDSLANKNRLIVKCKLFVDSGDVKKSSVLLSEKGGPFIKVSSETDRDLVKTQNKRGGSKLIVRKSCACSIPLYYNSEYVISLESEGYVTKRVKISTAVPVAALKMAGFDPYAFGITLRKKNMDGSDCEFKDPIYFIHYSADVDDFNYDTEYYNSLPKSVLDCLEKTSSKYKNVK
jgi:hypothetical protein